MKVSQIGLDLAKDVFQEMVEWIEAQNPRPTSAETHLRDYS
jgi:hypothetical protein